MAAREGVSGWAVVRRCGLACVALILLYFAIPIQVRDGGTAVAMRIAFTVLALAVLVLAIWRQVLRQLHQPGAPLGGLIVSIVAGVLLFSLTDYTLAYYAPDQFEGLDTRLDALYFAMSTLLTVGFGDIHARGQVARGLLCVQMLFNVAVLATTASLLTHEIGERARAARRS
jgi:voltage-gated potassium channel